MASAPTASPDLVIHEINNAGVATSAPVTGIAPSGTLQDVEPASPYFNGRVWKYKGCTDGGLFTAPDDRGWTLEQLLLVGAGTTSVRVYLRDPDVPVGQPDFLLFETAEAKYVTGAPNPAKLTWSPDGGVFVPPLWKLAVVTTGNLSGPASIVIKVSDGWGHSLFQSVVTA